MLKRRIKIIFLIGVLLFSSMLLVFWFAKYAVISDERTDNFGNSYGYKIEKYVFWNSSKLTIWNQHSHFYRMYSIYNLSSLTVEEVVENKWLKNDAAIYLNLKIKYHDSVVSVSPTRIIYDFHRGELHTSSGFTLWRFFDDKNDSKDWMNEDEFDAVLLHFNK